MLLKDRFLTPGLSSQGTACYILPLSPWHYVSLCANCDRFPPLRKRAAEPSELDGTGSALALCGN